LFKKILIANRGEIALRIIRCCREMDIRTVAVYSEIDAESLHVRYADEHICIGPPSSSRSYLNIPAIISAAEITGAEAIHPGYGFLAENPHFAEICESCKIKFIGPTAETIRLMGDKVKAREIMRKAKVPVIPGSDGPIVDEKEAMTVARKIGFPVIIKAVAGGGGRGMRIVHSEGELANAFATARVEAEAAFGNPTIYIEKYIEKPRHIEFQILADEQGNVIHLGERDCTMQRRHQKLLEESPSIALTPRLRREMGRAVIVGARAIGYTNAGTMEFLLDRNGNFYFMEMNTRIQVEHPVTEMVTGTDLIREQVLIAMGEKFRGNQSKKLEINGHAIECRIYAEDWEKNFTPCAGTITSYNVPGGPGVRVDSHVYSGYTVPPHYDSLLAKLIVHGRNRKEAVRRMQRALDEYVIEGIKTTIPFHKKVLREPAFLKGDIHTGFIDLMEKEEGKENE